jgi:hypothetical protein
VHGSFFGVGSLVFTRVVRRLGERDGYDGRVKDECGDNCGSEAERAH